MTKLLVVLFAFLQASNLPTTSTSMVEEKKINIEQSEVNWKGYKVTGSHEGTIQIADGTLVFEDGALTGGSIKIDMNSIKTTDLSGGTAEKLDGHLKSDDFFGVNNFPFATFVITKSASRGIDGEYRITGNLTIKETTKEVKLNASVKDGKVVAEMKIDRTDFDVRYGSGSFFDDLGDKTIYDEFDIKLNLAY